MNIFCLLLRKSVYPYKYLDNWKRFNETSLIEKKKKPYSNLMEDITDAGYKHAKRGWKILEDKKQKIGQ